MTVLNDTKSLIAAFLQAVETHYALDPVAYHSQPDSGSSASARPAHCVAITESPTRRLLN